MTAPSDLCHTKPPCPSWTGKHCGHKVLYGEGACWRLDGRPERKVGLQDNDSPYAGKTEKET